MIAQFLADIKSGNVDVPESTVMNKKLLIDKYFTVTGLINIVGML